jgi:hypothetical protein
MRERFDCPQCGAPGTGEGEWENDETHLIEGTFRHASKSDADTCKSSVTAYQRLMEARDPVAVLVVRRLRMGAFIVETMDGKAHIVAPTPARLERARTRFRQLYGRTPENNVDALTLFGGHSGPRDVPLLGQDFVACPPPPPDFDRLVKTTVGAYREVEAALREVESCLKESWHDMSTVQRLRALREAAEDRLPEAYGEFALARAENEAGRPEKGAHRAWLIDAALTDISKALVGRISPELKTRLAEARGRLEEHRKSVTKGA